MGNYTRYQTARFTPRPETAVYHTLHLFAELTFSGGAVICSLVVMYMAIFRTNNKAVKVYALMLIMNATVDLTYSVVNLVAMPIFFIYNGLFIVATGNPFLRDKQYAALVVSSLQGFLTYLSVVILPIQYIYRYSVVRNRPLTTYQLIIILLIAMLYPFVHGVLCYLTFNPPTPEYDAILELDPVVASLGYLPPYYVGDIKSSFLMTFHMANCMIITVISYAVITVVFLKTKKEFIKMESKMSHQTKKVQRQMERVIFIQALFPILVLFIPGTYLPVAAFFQFNSTLSGEFLALIHTTPLFNSICVMLCVPSYRRLVTRAFARRTGPSSLLSTDGKPTSIHSETWRNSDN
ncbi:unnamed protein product [Bursaphelenchus xylophilus]|uniref:(pine wood nematode) hypothetical protein n=1 Tax=Bursaphelenchus xylophilus TaxID=6326 RepID=A0A1I7RMI6_BURXY|nr:unnamed protein product [Bursaphelenchus xylophilus]CAG9118526.1 unnamed protein product [Bursaphelenchus xylophilus]